MGEFGALDRALYALFSRHADRSRHDRDRTRYRGAALSMSFDRYVAWTYGLSWIVGGSVAAAAVTVGLAVPAATTSEIATVLHASVPLLNRLDVPAVPRYPLAVAGGTLAGLIAKDVTVRAAGTYLRWRVSARRTAIDRTLPGAVRYLRALANGADDRRTMFRKVAEQDAYGETATAFRAVLNTAALTGSLDDGLRRVSRDTPSRELLSPFLLKFREHASQGGDALAGYLRMESRMLSHRQDRARQRAADFLELLAELFIVLLVLPALFVVILTVLSVLAPGLSERVPTPLGPVTVRGLSVYASAGFALVVGAGAAALVDDLRPPDQAPPSYARPGGLGTLATALSNPASAALLFVPVALLVAVTCRWLGYQPVNVALVGYVAYGLPVGAVAVRRAGLDDAKDREVKDFVHAVAGHVSLGRPFGEAVELVAREVDLGALQSDVDDLAFTLGLTTGPSGNGVRAEALEQFTARVGTPLAEQTMGLVTGALEVGGDAETVFETLQTEVGRLYHERKALRSALLVYVAVGWTTALLVVGIMVAVNLHVLDGFAQLSAVSGSRVAIDPDAVQPARERRRFYLVTQATMLASGWFAGMASRGRYEALLHSAALVLACYAVFSGAGML